MGAPGVGGERVEGRRAVTELLTAGRRRVRTVWVAAGRSADLTELADDATRRVIESALRRAGLLPGGA